MRNKNVTFLLMVTVLSLAALGAASRARGQETKSKLTSKQLQSLIATAKTPEDHQKIAAYYRDMAAEAKANAAEHEKDLAAYNENPSTHPLAKASGGPAAHCRTLIRLYNDEAKEDLAMAEEHEQMAKDAARAK
jgi:hypothetical protein